jgi:hypothetical protein
MSAQTFKCRPNGGLYALVLTGQKRDTAWFPHLGSDPRCTDILKDVYSSPAKGIPEFKNVSEFHQIAIAVMLLSGNQPYIDQNGKIGNNKKKGQGYGVLPLTEEIKNAFRAGIAAGWNPIHFREGLQRALNKSNKKNSPGSNWPKWTAWANNLCQSAENSLAKNVPSDIPANSEKETTNNEQAAAQGLSEVPNEFIEPYLSATGWLALCGSPPHSTAWKPSCRS